MFLRARESIWLPVTFYSFLALALSGFLLPFADYVTSDGVGYLRMAENLFSGKGININPGEPLVRHHPFYSFLVGGINLLLRNIEFSGHFISMLSFSLTVIPLFLLTRAVYSKDAARWASFLYATHGFLLAHSNLIMTEALFTFLLILQLYGFHSQVQANKVSPFWGICLGTVGGLGYLTRPEGMLFYLVGLVSFLLLCPKPPWAKIRFGLLSLAVFLIFFLPYATFVSRLMGHLELGGQGREQIIRRQLDFAHPDQYQEVKKIEQGLSGDKRRFKMDELVEQFRLVHYLKADHFALLRGGLSSIPIRLVQFGNYFFGGLGFLLVGASWVSIPWDAKRKRSELLLMAFILPFLPYLFLLFYPRRYVPFLPIFLIWMGNGMSVFIHWLRKTFNLSEKKVGPAVCMLGLILLLPSAWYLRRALPKGDFPFDDKALGLWMKKNILRIREEGVASQAQFVNFYSGAKMLGLPYVEKFEDFLTFMAHHRAKYFVVSEDLEEPVRQTYRFLLDETLPLPPGISRRFILRGEKKKMILFEIGGRPEF